MSAESLTIKAIITNSLLKNIVDPPVSFDSAEKLAIAIMNDLYDHDRFTVHLPDATPRIFRRPKGQ